MKRVGILDNVIGPNNVARIYLTILFILIASLYTKFS
jgi:rRNA processing protein Gar1